jgi:hypothetical protein
MNLAALWLAVRARALGDTGTGGLFNATTPLVTGIYLNSVPPNPDTAYPYIRFDATLPQGGHGFRIDLFQPQLRFHIFALEQGGGHSRCSLILERLYARFHRHALTMATGGWTATQAACIDTFLEPDDPGVLHFIQTYRLHISKGVS